MDDPYWETHYELIKALYQDKRKPLAAVRHILINEHGFPSLSIQKYERKIRDDLRLRVKLKAADWNQIRLYAESHGFSFGSYDVLLNGTRMMPKTVNKEIRRRRNQATGTAWAGSLPADVQVIHRVSRSPRIIPKLITRPQQFMANKSVGGHKSAALVNSSLAALRCQNLETTQGNELNAAFLEFVHENLPWNEFRRTVSSVVNGDKTLEHFRIISGMRLFYIPNDGFTPGVHDVVSARLANTIYPSSAKLFGESLDSSRPEAYWTQKLYILVYLLSNSLHSGMEYDLSFVQLLELLKVVFRYSNQAVLTALFKVDLASTRVLYRRCVSELNTWVHKNVKRQPDLDIDFAMQLLIRVLDFHPKWVRDKRSKLMYISAALHCNTIMRKVCSYGFADYSENRLKKILSTTLTIAALSKSSACIDCLISHCFSLADTNASEMSQQQNQVAYTYNPEATIPRNVILAAFPAFVQGMILHSARYYDSSFFAEILETLLYLGADPDMPFPRMEVMSDHFDHVKRHYYESVKETFFEEYGQDHHFKLSLLDASLYLCIPIFLQMHPFSHDFEELSAYFASRLEIIIIILRYDLQLDSHVTLLRRDPEEGVMAYREFLLLEQFFFLPHARGASLNSKHARIARALLESGVTIKPCRTLCCEASLNDVLLRVWVLSVLEYGLTTDLRIILSLLRRFIPRISQYILDESVEDTGTEILNALWDHGFITEENLPFAASALIQAAKAQNYLAFDWILLRANLDINGEFSPDLMLRGSSDGRFKLSDKRARTLISYYFDIVTCGRDYDESRFSKRKFCGKEFSVQVLRHFLNSGAKLRLTREDQSCYPLISHALRCLNRGDSVLFLSGLKNILPDIEIMSSVEWAYILRLILFENSTRCVGLQTACDPSYWQFFDYLCQKYYIPSSGPILTQLVLAGGSRKQAQDLIANGSDVNEIDGFYTPLSAAIRVRDLDFGYWLIEHGARPSGSVNNNALHECCSIIASSPREQSRKMAFIAKLISMGANVNERACSNTLEKGQTTPLYECAIIGDIEAATYLLKHQADPNLTSILLYMTRKARAGNLWRTVTALDIAVRYHRLDMTRLLLKFGAMSGIAGITGYDGVSRRTKTFRALIREQISINSELFRQSAYSRDRHQALIESLQQSSRFAFQNLQEDGEIPLNDSLMTTIPFVYNGTTIDH